MKETLPSPHQSVKDAASSSSFVKEKKTSHGKRVPPPSNLALNKETFSFTPTLFFLFLFSLSFYSSLCKLNKKKPNLSAHPTTSHLTPLLTPLHPTFPEPKDVCRFRKICPSCKQDRLQSASASQRWSRCLCTFEVCPAAASCWRTTSAGHFDEPPPSVKCAHAQLQ